MHNEQAENKSIILIVDDSLTNLAVFSEYLSRLHSDVLVAINGVDALAQLEESKPDIILLDVIMPGIDGFETCRRIKKNPATKDIPVIFMTTLSDTVDKVKGLSLGAVDYVTKPFQEEEVVARIKTHITISRLQKELRAQNSWLQQEIAERREAEDTLHKRNEELSYSEARFRDLVMNLSDWVWEFDDRLCITYSSGHVRDMLGYEVEEVLGKTPFEFMSLEQATEFESILTELMADKLPLQEQEVWVMCKDGGELCLLTSGMPIFDNMARVVGYRGASKDITERKQMEQIAQEYNTMLEMEVSARTEELEENYRQLEQQIADRQQIEAALRLSEERLNLAVNGAHYGVWDWNLDANELYLSPHWKSLLGYEDHEIPNHPDQWKKRIHPEDLPEAVAAVGNYLKGETPVYENIFRMLHKSGQFIWVLERGIAVWDEMRKKPRRFVGTLMDLTAQKETESGLRYNQERYDLAWQVSGEALWDWNIEDNSVVFSSRWKTMLGYAEHEVTEQYSERQSRIHPDDAEYATHALNAYLEKSSPVYQAIFHLQHKDGAWIKVWDRGIVVRDDNGTATRFVGTCLDISQFNLPDEANTGDDAEYLKALGELVGEGFWVWRVAEQRVEYSPAWNRLIGYPDYETFDSTLEVFQNRLHPDDKNRVMAAIERYLAKDSATLQETHRLQHYDGRYLTLITRGAAEWDAAGEALYLVVSHQNISENERLAAELEKQQNYCRNLIQNAGMGLVLCHLDGSLVECNLAFANMLGYDKVEDILPLNYFEQLTSPEDRETDKQHLRKMKTSGHFDPYNKNCLHRQGHAVTIKVSGIIVEKPGAEQLIWMNVESLAAG
jgi:PAS domain S-box-containing protein